MKKRALLVFAPLLVVAFLFTGCGVKTTHKSVSAAAVVGGKGWKPSTPIRVKEGDKVVIKVGNLTTETHGFSIDYFGIKQTVGAGKTIQVKFTPTVKGHYVVYCQLHPAHKKTELIVS